MLTKKLLWVTDPWSTLEHSQDTTLRLAQEALNLGVSSYWSGSDFVLNSAPDSFLAVPIFDQFTHQFRGPGPNEGAEVPASSFYQIHYRVDPPVDAQYINLVEKIAGRVADRNCILNPIPVITQQSEKIPPLELMHLAPLHLVIQSEGEAEKAYAAFHCEEFFVTKPMNLAQSIGVERWKTPASSTEFVQIIKTASLNFTRPILLEEYLPGIKQGEVRMWFAMGKFVAALKKHPKPGDFRVLIDEGSKVEAYHLNETEERIAAEVGQSLRKQGIALAAIDFISGKISDYNITSPGLLVQLEAVHQKNFAREVILNLLDGF